MKMLKYYLQLKVELLLWAKTKICFHTTNVFVRDLPLDFSQMCIQFSAAVAGQIQVVSYECIFSDGLPPPGNSTAASIKRLIFINEYDLLRIFYDKAVNSAVSQGFCRFR